MYAILLLLLNFYDADPQIVVSRETTYITEPLRADGLPDYKKYVLGLYRKGATPENNAAIPLWIAFWPQNLEPGHYEMMRLELGLKATPSATATLQRLHGDANMSRVKAWFAKEHASMNEDEQYDLISSASNHAWTSEQFPPLADWTDANKQPLDLLVEASRRPRFYSPSPTLLNDQRDPLINVLLPGTKNMREAAWALSARAMRQVGENRLPEAWSDLLAMHRLARLTAQGQSLIEQSVAMEISDIACDGTLSLLGNDHLTIELAQQVNKDLDILPNVTNVVDRIDDFERMMALDSVIRVKQEGLLGFIRDVEALSASGVPEKENSKKDTTRDPTRNMAADWNAALKKVNSWQDRLINAAKRESRPDQRQALKRFNDDLSAERNKVKPQAIFATSNLNERGEIIGSIVACLMIPSTDTAIDAEYRHRTTFQLARLAAAIAIFRAEHTHYPATLDELTPIKLKTLRADLFNSKPFVYKRTDDGYLLYSVGDNGLDDGGNNKTLQILQGRPLEEFDLRGHQTTEMEIPESDDISVRLPRKVFTLPLKKASEK